MSFQDKVVIVTGSSSGIGAATAIKFAEEGAKVVIVARNKQKLDDVAKKCGNPLIIVADVSKDEDARRIINETIRNFGQLDILINNTGIGGSISFLDEQAMAKFDQVMSTNLRSIVYLTHLAAPHLVKTKGNIINISSVVGLRPFGNKSFSYNTSKAGLDHLIFSRSVAHELASSGVRVNVISPEPVRTDAFENMGLTKEMEEAIFNKLQKMTVLDRISGPEEIADLILFTASDKSVAITGSTLISDNGVMAKYADAVKLITST